MLNIKLKELLYRILEKFVVSSQTLATGVTLYRYGNMRYLEIVNTSVSQATLATISAGDRPIANARAVCRYRATDNTFYMGLITVETNGSVSASYCSGTNASAITSGQIHGSVTWIVAN